MRNTTSSLSQHLSDTLNLLRNIQHFRKIVFWTRLILGVQIYLHFSYLLIYLLTTSFWEFCIIIKWNPDFSYKVYHFSPTFCPKETSFEFYHRDFRGQGVCTHDIIMHPSVVNPLVRLVVSHQTTKTGGISKNVLPHNKTTLALWCDCQGDLILHFCKTWLLD